MKKIYPIRWVLAGVLAGAAAWAAEQPMTASDELARAFACPPAESKPWV
jgi:hypothetical protein